MHNTKLIFAFLATSLASVYGQNLQDGSIDNNDVPPECQQQCASAIDLTTRCDNQNDDDDDDNNNVNDDQAERDCVCNDQNARQYLTDCGTCVAQYPNFFIDRDDDDGLNDNEVDLWLRQCSFGSVNTTSATITSAPTATGTACSTVAITTTIRDDDDDDDNDDQDDIRTITTNSVICGPSPTAVSTSVIVTTSGSSTFTSTVVFTSTPTTGSTFPQQTDNAAAGIAAPLAYAGAGACFLFAAFAL